jgi:hypothetical protein
MTSSLGGVIPQRTPGGDGFYYALASICGAAAAWADIEVGDLLLTTMVVLAACMLLGFLSPRKPWRWVLLVGACVPVVECFAHFFMTQKLERAQIYESFLAFLPGIAGAVGGSLARGVVDNLFPKK